MGKQIIIGGDFNTHKDPNLDKKGGNVEALSVCSEMLKSFMSEFDLCDIYCVQHPTQHRFTWHNKGKGGLVQSRLDMFLVSEDFKYHNMSSYIHPSIKFDDSIVKINYINIRQWARSQGFYKLNTILLKRYGIRG